ncbi:MAG: glycosyltransferase [Opitutaceae bacterium]|nr:glycosyltransferase [Opitutaceae bacterium]
MVKILQLVPSDTLGIHQLTKSIQGTFSSNKFELTTAYLNPTSTQKYTTNIKYFNFSKSATKGFRIRALLELYKFCKDEQFDIIITHRFKALYLILILNKFLDFKKCFFVIHGFDDFHRSSRKKLLTFFWGNNCKFIAISDAVKNYLTRLENTSTPRQIITIDNSINTSHLTRSFIPKDDSQKVLGITSNGPVLGTIGRLVPLKGHMTLLNAFKKFLVQQPNAHLIIIGEGRNRKKLEEYIKIHNLTNSITLPGYIKNASKYLKALDLFILPSLKEGFGLVLLEAMAARVPIVASRTGGIPYVLGSNASLYAPGDIEGLLEKILFAIDLPAAEKLKRTNLQYDRLMSKFDETKFQQKWVELINTPAKQY